MWVYLPEQRYLVDSLSLAGGGRRIAEAVDPRYGPRLALAPRMEALIRKMDAYRRAVASPCDCAECREVAAIVRDLDEARAGVAS